MLTNIKKIFTDTLCSPRGKYSRKSLTMFTSFVIGAGLTLLKVGTTMPILANFKMDVPDALILYFLAMATGQGAMAVWDKKKPNQDETT